MKYDKSDGRFSFIYVQLKIIVIRKVNHADAIAKQLVQTLHYPKTKHEKHITHLSIIFFIKKNKSLGSW